MTDNKTKEKVLELFDTITDMYTDGIAHLIENDRDALAAETDGYDRSVASQLVRDMYGARIKAMQDCLELITGVGKAARKELEGME